MRYRLRPAFREYLEFKDIKPVLHGDGKSRTIAMFQEYLTNGGYPETVNLPSMSIRTAYLQEYYNSMLLRDIVEYNQLSNYSYLRNLYRQASTTIGKTVSIRRLYNHLKAHQYSVGIFLELYRRYGNIYNQNIFYYSDGTVECDFIIYAEDVITLPIQVSWSLADPITRQRELRGLVKACEYSQVREGWIVTSDEEDEFDFEGVHVLVKPAWKWMLND